MKVIPYFRSLADRFLNHSQVAEEMEEELRSHIQHRADDLERSGLSRIEAERRARVEFGGRGKYAEECDEALGGSFVGTVVQDVRFSIRVLRKSPGFTIAAVFTLALAIGANAVVFSVMNAFILRPLNVPNAQSLYGIWRPADGDAQESYPDYLDLRDRNRSFDDLVAYSITLAGIDTGENPSRVWIEEASGNYFDALGLQPYLGHFFHASDERGPNSAPYIVLTYAFWHTHFQDDRSVVGRVVRTSILLPSSVSLHPSSAAPFCSSIPTFLCR
jgi:MacB-like periplasmic core domain